MNYKVLTESKVKLLFIIILLLIGFSTNSLSQSVSDAIVKSIKGKAYVRNEKTGEGRRLKNGEGLVAGQQIKCEKDCQELIISYCNIARPQVNSPKWKTIRALNCNSARNSRRAGSPKGEGITIVSPRNGEVIQPKNFSLRLESGKFSRKINIKLKVNLGEKLWSKEGIDTNSLVSESEDIINALKIAQKKGEFSFAIVISEDDKEKTQIVVFNIISSEQQKSLDKDLEVFIDEEDEVLRSIGRGLAFSKYNLFTDAIQELEKALNISQSQNVTQVTLIGIKELLIIANYHAYNDEQVKQLCASLSKSKSLPVACSQIGK